MTSNESAFWTDLIEDLQDPEFLREYVTQSIRVSTIDTVVNALNVARESAGLSKAQLARAINMDPATVRRLFTANGSNPTLGTLAEVAAVLGLRISVTPASPLEQDIVAASLRAGGATDTEALVAALDPTNQVVPTR